MRICHHLSPWLQQGTSANHVASSSILFDPRAAAATSPAGAGARSPALPLSSPRLLRRCCAHCCQDLRESWIVPNTGAEKQPPSVFWAEPRILFATSLLCNNDGKFKELPRVTRWDSNHNSNTCGKSDISFAKHLVTKNKTFKPISKSS